MTVRLLPEIRHLPKKQYKIARTHYTNALIGLPNEKYPKDQIAKVDELLAQLEMGKDFSCTAGSTRFDSESQRFSGFQCNAMTAAAELDRNKQYPEAIAKYEDAIKIKPEQKRHCSKVDQQY